jgi:hypothetical protein
MDVLAWMKRACIVAFVLGGIGYLMFLAWWIHVLASEFDRWERETGSWLHVAEAPLVVILLSAISYSLTCMAERFRLPRVLSQHEEDFGDHPRRSPPPA